MLPIVHAPSPCAMPSPTTDLEVAKKELIDQIKASTNSIFEKSPEMKTKETEEFENKLIKNISQFDEFKTVEELCENLTKVTMNFKDGIIKALFTEIAPLAPSQAELQRFKQELHLKNKKCNRDIEKEFKEAFSKNLSIIEMAAQISEDRNCPIDQITEKDIEDKIARDKKEDADRRERACQELLREAAEPKKKAKGSIKAKNPKGALPRTKKEKNTPPKPVLKPSETSPSPTELRSQYILSLHERPSLPEHPRVTKRWRTKNPGEIRNFEDTLASGERIKRYEGLSDPQIRYLRACHYLPCLEKIFAEGCDKRMYTFRTEKGLGMAAILHHDNQKHYGFINFGIGSDGFLYHRFFEKTDSGQLLQAIQRTGKELVPVAPVKDEEKWTTASKCQFEVLEDRAIHVSYPDEEHAITIYPIRKELR